VQPLKYPSSEGGGREDEFWITEVQLERGEEWKFEATVYQEWFQPHSTLS